MPQEILDQYGIKRTEITFTNNKKAMIRLQDGMEDEIRDNVTSIAVEVIAGIVSITVNYREDKGEGTRTSSIENIREIIIVDK